MQCQVLQSIRDSHIAWLESTIDPERKRLHQEFMVFVGKAADHCTLIAKTLDG